MKLVRLGLLALLLPAAAEAQDSRLFVDGGAFLGVLFAPSANGDPTLFSFSSSPTYEWNDLNGDGRWQPGEEGALLPSSSLFQTSKDRTAPGGSASVGLFLSPAVSLRLEAAFQGEHATSIQSTTTAFITQLDGRQTQSVTDFAIAAGWHHGASSRASVTFLGGVVFRRLREETVLTTSYRGRNFISPTGSSFTTLPSSSAFEQTFTSTDYRIGVVVGADVPIRLWSSISLVPHVRLVAAEHEWNLRPAVALRWQP